MDYGQPEVATNHAQGNVDNDQDGETKASNESPAIRPRDKDEQETTLNSPVREKDLDDIDQFQVSSVITLHVVKIYNRRSKQTSTANENSSKQSRLEHLKMELDCSQCLEDGDDSALRRFRRKVQSTFKMGEHFKIYDSSGLLISESDLYFLNQPGKPFAVVYVSHQCESFNYEMYLKMFKNQKKLGQGGFGIVYLGQHMITGEKVAIKLMMPNHITKASEAGKVFKEAQVLQKLNHDSIVKLSNVFQLADTKIVMMMENLEGGTLNQYIEDKGGKLNESEAQKIFTKVAQAVKYCHQKNVVHRDIKLENILLKERGNIDKGLKLIDFGIAGKTQFDLEQHKAGTLRYCPPELVSGKSFKADPSFDAWSLGILLYRLVYNQFPFSGPDWKETKKQIINCKLKFPKSTADTTPVSESCQILIKVLLQRDPEKRPKLYQLTGHPWLSTRKTSLMMDQTMHPLDTIMEFFKASQKDKEEEDNPSPKTKKPLWQRKPQLSNIDRNKKSVFTRRMDKAEEHKLKGGLPQFKNQVSPYIRQETRLQNKLIKDQQHNIRVSIDQSKKKNESFGKINILKGQVDSIHTKQNEKLASSQQVRQTKSTRPSLYNNSIVSNGTAAKGLPLLPQIRPEFRSIGDSMNSDQEQRQLSGSNCSPGKKSPQMPTFRSNNGQLLTPIKKTQEEVRQQQNSACEFPDIEKGSESTKNQNRSYLDNIPKIAVLNQNQNASKKDIQNRNTNQIISLTCKNQSPKQKTQESKHPARETKLSRDHHAANQSSDQNSVMSASTRIQRKTNSSTVRQTPNEAIEVQVS